ncbi:MAG: class I SAM-dependent DNA methyltransferase, partial [Candidatus Thorarchaeota archaeon]
MNSRNFLKKAAGEFYTPTYVVDYIVTKVTKQLEKDGRILKDSFKSFKKSILNLSFCDPSVGTGNFLLGLFRWFWKELRFFEEIDPQEKELFFISFVSSNVYGVDINQDSLDICINRLIHEYPSLTIKNLSNLRIGNSIVDHDAQQILGKNNAMKLLPFSWEQNFHRKKGYDVIFGNPPYYNLKKMCLKNEEAQLLFNYLKTAKNWKKYFRASSDIYYFFIIKSLNLMQENGYLSFIIPNYWLQNKYSDLLREFLLQFQILEILDLGELNIFRDEGKWLNISTCILTSKKSQIKEKITVIKNVPRNFFSKKIQENSLQKYSFYIHQEQLGKDKWLLSPYLQEINKITNNENLIQLGNIVKIIQGVSPGLKSIFVLSQQDIDKYQIEEELIVPFVTNKDIKSWIIQA